MYSTNDNFFKEKRPLGNASRFSSGSSVRSGMNITQTNAFSRSKNNKFVPSGITTNYPVSAYTPVGRNFEEVQGYLEDIDSHVQSLLERRNMLLRTRYFTVLHHIKDLKKFLVQTQKHLKELEMMLNGRPEMLKVVAQLEFFKEFQELMNNMAQDIASQIETRRAETKVKRAEYEAKKRTLNEKNHENIKLAAIIYRHKKSLGQVGEVSPMESVRISAVDSQTMRISQIIPKSTITPKLSLQNELFKANNRLVHGHFRSSRTGGRGGVNLALPSNEAMSFDRMKKAQSAKNITSNIFFEPVLVTDDERPVIIKELRGLYAENKQTRTFLVSYCSNFLELNSLYADCWTLLERLVMRSQEFSSPKGMQGSLLFVLLASRNNKPLVKDGPSILNLKSAAKSKTPFRRQQEGEAVDVIYETFQRMLKPDLLEEAKAKVLSRTVSAQAIRGFSALQIMGLLLIREDIAGEMKDEFAHKSRLVGSVFSEVKSRKTPGER